MRYRFPAFLFLAFGLGLSAGPAAFAKAVPIVPDGFFKDWKKAGDPFVDPSGDAAESRVDLGKVWVANDDDALYLRFQVGRETLLQSDSSAGGNRLRLYLDADKKSRTGLPIEGIGADIEVRFGEQEVIVYDKDGIGTDVDPGVGLSMGFPSHTSSVFEVRVELPEPKNPKKRRKMKFVLLDESLNGDRFPDAGSRKYKFPKKTRVEPTDPISLDKAAGRIRLLSLNTERATIIERQDLYRRLIGVLQPDILAFQEIFSWSPRQVANFVESALGTPASGEWSAVQNEDVTIVSAFPILASIGIDANQAAHIDLPDDLTPHELVLFNAHPPCCTNDAGRDFEIDNMMATWRDLLQGTGPFSIDPMDAVILTGDFNMVGFRRQFDAIVHGRFIDSSNGPDFSPGRDEGSLAVASLRHTHRRLAYTWRRETSAFAPGRLDFVFFSDDVVKEKKSFVFDTASMPDDLLDSLGLEAGDSLLVSDHLPLVVDFSFASE